jgi:hypothetical protein
MFIIKDKNIFTEDGLFLKKIDCPKKATVKDLIKETDKKLLCNSCKKNVLETEYMSEIEIRETLEKDQTTCLKISRLNPMFRFT